MRATEVAKNLRRHEFADRAALAEALSAVVAGVLRDAIDQRGAATLAVSGGSTPGLFFDALSSQEIDWSNVTVLPVDERIVPETSERSNARLIRSRLLQNAAAAARFLTLYQPTDPEAAAREADDHVGRLGLPLDVVILGMGNDGHTASFFPDADALEALLDSRTTKLVSAVHAASAGEARLTLTLPPIASARLLALHIEGAEKAATLEQALTSTPALPISRVIKAAETPVEVFWAS